MDNRVDKIRNMLQNKAIDGVLICKPINIRYISGFTGSVGYIIITQNEAKLFVDFRYVEQAQKQCRNLDIIEYKELNCITTLIQNLKIGSLGIEEDFVNYKYVTSLKNKLEKIQLVELNGALTMMRAIKDEKEIELIKKSAQLCNDGFNYILDFIKPGVSEVDIAIELEFYMRKRGASGPSFDFIVASGQRSSLPHGVASKKIIEDGDLLTIDFGCIVEGYCSDMTRTVAVGKVEDKQEEIYSIVLAAQNKALKSVRPGITGKELDGIARNFIDESGFGANFGHGLGHGVGLEIHELPTLNWRGEIAMEPGMVITIEPGIYIPNSFGVRIEDLVVVTQGGYKVLTNVTKELIKI